MKKLLIAGVLCLCLGLSGCGTGESNVDVGGLGMLRLPDGTVIQGEVEALTRWSYAFYEVTIDGVVYCVHPSAFAVIQEEG